MLRSSPGDGNKDHRAATGVAAQQAADGIHDGLLIIRAGGVDQVGDLRLNFGDDGFSLLGGDETPGDDLGRPSTGGWRTYPA